MRSSLIKRASALRGRDLGSTIITILGTRLGGAKLDREREALNDLRRVVADHVHPDDPLVVLTR